MADNRNAQIQQLAARVVRANYPYIRSAIHYYTYVLRWYYQTLRTFDDLHPTIDIIPTKKPKSAPYLREETRWNFTTKQREPYQHPNPHAQSALNDLLVEDEPQPHQEPDWLQPKPPPWHETRVISNVINDASGTYYPTFADLMAECEPDDVITYTQGGIIYHEAQRTEEVVTHHYIEESATPVFKTTNRRRAPSQLALPSPPA